MADRNQRLSIKDLRAGRNGVDPPQALSESHCVEALNVDWYNATFARKRGGTATVTTSSSPFTGQTVSTLHRHVPSTDDTAAELWGTDDAATPHVGRLAGGTTWATPTLKDAPTGSGWNFSGASLNGLFFLAYQSAQDRLHCYDPASGTVRRTGLAAMGTPSVADTGAGTYTNVKRYYRTRATTQSGGVTIYRSEPSSSQSFTPSGSGTAARVTQGTVPNEGETHWEVEVSLDSTTFYRLATVVIGTTTYDDSAATSTYATNPLSDSVGTYSLQKSYKFIAVDQSRLLGFGSYTSTDPQNTVEFSAVLGASNVSDVERIPLNNTQTLDEKDSSFATGLVGPVNGSYFPFKYRQVWQMTPTGNAIKPYNTTSVSKTVGAVFHKAIAVGEDEQGNAAIYFMSHRGPWRYGIRGMEYLGKPIEDRILPGGAISTMNLAATHVPAHTVWYGDKRQVWFWFATGSNNDPDTLAVFTLGRVNQFFGAYAPDQGTPSGWSVFTGPLATSRCAVAFSNTLGATMSRDLKPYVGSSATTNLIGKADTGTQDYSTPFAGSVTLKAYSPWGEGMTGDIKGGTLTAKVSSGVTVQVTTIRDFGLETQSDTVLLTPQTTETRTQQRIGGGAVMSGGMSNVQWTVGDPVAANNGWQIDELAITYGVGAPIVA